MGSKTAQYLEQYISNTILIPEQQNSLGVISIIKGLENPTPISLISAENGSQEIQNHAKDNHLELTQINVYQRHLPTTNKSTNWINKKLEISVLATSVSILENLKLLLNEKEWLVLKKQLFVCASNRIEVYAHQLGIQHTLNANSANPKVIAESLSDYFLKNNHLN